MADAFEDLILEAFENENMVYTKDIKIGDSVEDLLIKQCETFKNEISIFDTIKNIDKYKYKFLEEEQ